MHNKGDMQMREWMMSHTHTLFPLYFITYGIDYFNICKFDNNKALYFRHVQGQINTCLKNRMKKNNDISHFFCCLFYFCWGGFAL